MKDYEKLLTTIKQSLSGVLPSHQVGRIAERVADALVYTKTLEEYNQFRRTIKVEAIKEFAELIKKAFPSIAGAVDFMAKEMVGE